MLRAILFLLIAAASLPAADAEPASSPGVRDVTPPDMTAPPPIKGPLVRIAPPPAPPAKPPPARTERLRHPVVASAGVIQAGGRKLTLAGIAAPDFAERCGEGAAAWPCGRMARAALRRFVRGRAIECEAPEGAEEIPDPARCRVGTADLSAWLVAQGWAKRAGPEHAALEAAARTMRRGLWGDSRPADQAGDGTPASSPDSALAISERVSGTP